MHVCEFLVGQKYTYMEYHFYIEKYFDETGRGGDTAGQ
jgi:hypothetical protein